MTDYPRRLIEVDLPIQEISAHARREKSIRHGHISTLHIWWARRPLAACRSVILAALWPDPADPRCPKRFQVEAADSMKKWRDRRGGPHRDWDDPTAVRAALLDFIAELANWDNSTKRIYLDTARHLVRAAHESLGGTPGTKPLVVDPFAGGGTIPLEALRVGADAFASDLNPVAVLLNKVVLEYVPKYGVQLARELRRWGGWVRDRAAVELRQFYPKGTDGAVPIAYLWARTIRCEGPGCGAEVPLVRSLWLSKKRGRSASMRLVPYKDDRGIRVEFEDNPKTADASQGTVRRGSATCPCCGYTTPVSSVRTQLNERRGGAADAKLLCVVTTRPGQPGRFYRTSVKEDLVALHAASEELTRREAENNGLLSLVPDEPLPVMSGVFNAPLYGHNTWGSLFTPRQSLVLVTLVRLVREASEQCRKEYDAGLAEAVTTCLALLHDRQVDYNSALCTWNTRGEYIGHTFGRQALPMVWDFVELQPFADGSGNFDGALRWIQRVVEKEASAPKTPSHAQLASATAHPLPDDSANAFVTDPPYYNAVPYADLSDFFYVWLRRTLGKTHPALFSEPHSPKTNEICEMAGWDPARYPEKTGTWFEAQMRQAMTEGRRILAPSGIGMVVFAHKSTAGWEAQLQAMIDAGWIVTASWPIHTEMGSRLRAMNSAVLASSVHLVCRPRENSDGSLRDDLVGDWRAVLRELPQRIHAWMPRLATEGVVGADAIFACLGPALEVFSRYSRVEKVSGERVELREYLEQVWAAVAREALSMIFEDADATGLEADARLTAMWLWTLSTSTSGAEHTGKPTSSTKFSLEFDAARKIAQGLGAHLEDLGHVVDIKGSRARLLSVAERTRYLFSKDQVQRPSVRRGVKAKQLTLFEELEAVEKDAGWEDAGPPPLGNTTLDRVHQAMVLFGAGRGEALKHYLVEEGVGRSVVFWRLAQSLSALYPNGTGEKRWVDGILARKRGLGFG